MLIDLNTSNTSFLEMAILLKEKYGVKNNVFFLKLYDDSLVGVDPRDPSLSIDTKAKIVYECLINPWYYFREVVLIPEDGGSARFRLDIGTLSQVFLTLHNVSIFKLQPRQTGKTITAATVYSYFYQFILKNSEILYMNKSHGDSKKNIKRTRDIIEALPKYLQFKHKKNNTAKETLFLHLRNNTITAKPTATNPTTADLLGRGLTSPMLWFDEYAFLKYNDIIYDAAIMAFSKSSENAEKYGSAYGVVITTTPNSVDVSSGHEAYTTMQTSARWDINMLDWSIEDIREHVKTGQTIFLTIEYGYRELNLDEEWLETQKRFLKYNMLKIKREILLEWPQSFDNSPFSEEELANISQHTKERMNTHRIDKYLFEIYETIDPNKVYVLGSDVGGGLGADSSTIVVYDPDDKKVAATFASNTESVTIPKFTKLIINVMDNWLPYSIIAIERNNYGLGIIQEIIETRPDLKRRLLYHYKNEINVSKNGEKIKDVRKNNSNKNGSRIYGVNTNGTSRDDMMDDLYDIILSEPTRLSVRSIYSQIKTLEIKKTSSGKERIEHMTGKHDDILFGFLILTWALKQRPTKKMIGEMKRLSYKNNINNLTKKTVKTNSILELNKRYNDNVIYNTKKTGSIFDLNRRDR